MLSLFVNIVIPTIIMTRFASEDKLGAVNALLIALAFPFAFGVYQMASTRKVGWVPVLGLVSIAISGGIGLLKLPAEWIAVKEAMIPAVLALAILVSAWIGRPLARIFLDAIIDKDKIYPILEAQGKMDDYERRTSVATWLLAFTFILSAVLNFVLAKVVVTADGGTQLYTEQIGRMTALSFPVITVPVFITLTATIFYIMSTLSKLTGLEMDEVLKDQRKQKSEA
jgi:intracellular septation protein A